MLGIFQKIKHKIRNWYFIVLFAIKCLGNMPIEEQHFVSTKA